MYISFDFPKPTPELKSRSDIAMRLNQLHSRFQMSQQQKNTDKFEKKKNNQGKRIMVRRQVCGKC